MSRRPAAKRILTRVAIGATVALAVAACSKNAPPAVAAVDVTAMTVIPHPVTFPEDYVAQTEAINAVEIRPRVGGMLERNGCPSKASPSKPGSCCSSSIANPISPRWPRRRPPWRRARPPRCNRSAIWGAPSHCRRWMPSVSRNWTRPWRRTRPIWPRSMPPKRPFAPQS